MRHLDVALAGTATALLIAMILLMRQRRGRPAPTAPTLYSSQTVGRFDDLPSHHRRRFAGTRRRHAVPRDGLGLVGNRVRGLMLTPHRTQIAALRSISFSMSGTAGNAISVGLAK
ncbi:MAG: hypothetical protein JWQ94_547 [Tardiphaga sp.]|nr:hypothetical protein [Tardiphaga sp.]